MRIGIDARAWGWTGIGRYARNLLRELSARAGAELHFTVFATPRDAGAIASLHGATVIPVRDSYYSFYEQTGFLVPLLRARLDLLHFLNFNLPVLYQRPFVVTIHDLTRFRFPSARHGGHLHEWAYRTVFRAAVQRARAVITVSEFTRAELLARFPQAAGKTVVIPEGVEERFSPARPGLDARDAETLRRLGLRRPYLLYVGLWLSHKNLAGLVRAFRLLKAAGYHGSLVVTGEPRPWDEDVRTLARAEGVEDVLLLPGRVADDDLPSLYREAEALVVPSFTEGFGLPPLEALACGTPVVAGRAGSLPEVLGDAALYADPHVPEHFAHALTLLRRDPRLRARLRERGLTQARRYSWERNARDTVTLYARVLKNSGTLGSALHDGSATDSVRPPARATSFRAGPPRAA